MKQSARIIRNNIPYTLLPNGVLYGEPLHVPTVTDARLLPDPPPPCITIGSTGASVTGSFYWDSASVSADDGSTVIQVTAIATGRYKAVSVSAGGGGGGTALSVSTTTALKAVLSSTLTDTQPATVQTPGTNWVWSAIDGAGFASDDITVIKPNDVSLGSNGRWYNTAPSPVVATYTAARLAVSGKQPTISVQAVASLNDGGGGTFDYDSTDTTSADNGGTILVAGSRRYKRRFTGAIDARWFGVIAYPTQAAAIAGTDSSAALLASTRAVSSIPNATAHAVQWPFGFIRNDVTLEISRPVRIHGHGKQSTILVCPGTVDGIVVNHSETSSDGGDGSRSVLEDFGIWATSSAHVTDGIQIHANAVSCNRISTYNWGRWGFQISASIGTGNANDWRMLDCVATACGSAGSGDDRGGVYVHGNDSSAGKCFGFQAEQIVGIGVREESFLGNYYEACHVEVASTGSYQTRAGQVSRSTFVSCYVEAAPAIKLYYPNCWLGGYPSSGFSSDSDGFIAPDSNGVFPFGVPNREAGTDSAIFYAGDWDTSLGGGAKNAVFGWWANGMSVNTENYSLFWDSTLFEWRMQRHATAAATSVPFKITGFGNDRPHSHFGVHNLLIDDVRITTGSAAPTTGLWRVGDKQINTVPTTGGIREWVCTTSGGWGSTWIPSHVYACTDAVYPRTPNGFVYELISYAGTSGATGAEPTWPLTPGTTVNDNGLTWKNVGPTPAIFDIVGGVATAVNRVVRSYPRFVTTEYSIDNDYTLTTLTTSTNTAVWPIEIPHGSTLNSIAVKVLGAGGHAALPATMPAVKLRKWNVSTANGSVSAGTSDTSANTAAFQAVHTITRSSIAEVIDNSIIRYSVHFESESGANALAGLVVLGITVNFTTTTVADLGAA